MLARRLRRLGFGGADLEDIMQDVALRLIRRGELGNDDQHFAGLAALNAKWAAADRWQLAARGGVEVENNPDAAQVPDGLASDPELVARFRQALAMLSPREQQVLARVQRGRKAQEIAAELGIAPATVRSIMRHVRVRITDLVL